MKILIPGFTLFFAGLIHAQAIDVRDVRPDNAESTVIEITKGKKSELKTDNKWEVQEGTADVEGESGATNKDAKAAWTKACNDWKKEFRTDNKENKILSMGCGTASCGGDVGAKVCTSKAAYKVKTLIN